MSASVSAWTHCGDDGAKVTEGAPVRSRTKASVGAGRAGRAGRDTGHWRARHRRLFTVVARFLCTADGARRVAPHRAHSYRVRSSLRSRSHACAHAWRAARASRSSSSQRRACARRSCSRAHSSAHRAPERRRCERLGWRAGGRPLPLSQTRAKPAAGCARARDLPAPTMLGGDEKGGRRGAAGWTGCRTSSAVAADARPKPRPSGEAASADGGGRGPAEPLQGVGVGPEATGASPRRLPAHRARSPPTRPTASRRVLSWPRPPRVLSDERRRHAYDVAIMGVQEGLGSGSRGEAAIVTLSIPVGDVYTDTRRTVRYDCRGPAASARASRSCSFRRARATLSASASRGSATWASGEAGDLTVVAATARRGVRVDGIDVQCGATVSLRQALCGAPFAVTRPDGRVRVRAPRGPRSRPARAAPRRARAARPPRRAQRRPARACRGGRATDAAGGGGGGAGARPAARPGPAGGATSRACRPPARSPRRPTAARSASEGDQSTRQPWINYLNPEKLSRSVFVSARNEWLGWCRLDGVHEFGVQVYWKVYDANIPSPELFGQVRRSSTRWNYNSSNLVARWQNTGHPGFHRIVFYRFHRRIGQGIVGTVYSHLLTKSSFPTTADSARCRKLEYLDEMTTICPHGFGTRTHHRCVLVHRYLR